MPFIIAKMLTYSIQCGLEDGNKSVKYLHNRTRGVQFYPEFEVFDTFFLYFMLCKMSAKSILFPKMTYFPLDRPRYPLDKNIIP